MLPGQRLPNPLNSRPSRAHAFDAADLTLPHQTSTDSALLTASGAGGGGSPGTTPPGSCSSSGAAGVLPTGGAASRANDASGAPQQGSGHSNHPTTYPNLVPNLILRDYYSLPGAEEDPDRDDFMENLQEAIYAYDALPSQDRFKPNITSDQQPQALFDLIAVVEQHVTEDSNVQRISPNLLHLVWDGLKRDQRSILREMHKQYAKIRGDTPVPKLGGGSHSLLCYVRSYVMS